MIIYPYLFYVDSKWHLPRVSPYKFELGCIIHCTLKTLATHITKIIKCNQLLFYPIPNTTQNFNPNLNPNTNPNHNNHPNPNHNHNNNPNNNPNPNPNPNYIPNHNHNPNPNPNPNHNPNPY